ncbi:MAG TPA: ABC transporter permease [Dongiaceae bacterium]|nr:ABC transporter permease [Dongiaceae bacterium]
MKHLGTLGAFIKRDFLIEISYRTSFILQFTGIFFSVFIWSYISNLFRAPKDMPGLYGIDYFAYVLVGLAFYHYLSAAMLSFSSKIRQEQTVGTLEAMLVTPTPIGIIVLGSSLWEFLMTSIKVAFYLVVGVCFGIRLHVASILPCLLILALTVLAFAGIGILSAAFILYLKRGDPITYVVSSASALFGGVFYPTEDMPKIVGVASKFLPITYSLRALRRSLLTGASFADLIPDIAILAIFAAILVPLGALAFRLAVKKARQEGSLVQY